MFPISAQEFYEPPYEGNVHKKIDFYVAAIENSVGEGFEPHIIAGPGIDGNEWYYIDSPTGLGGGQSGNLWISKDFGETWEPHPYGRNALGSGDSYTAIARDGTIYFTDLYLWSSTIDTSSDGGETWIRNPLATVTRVGDRQWLSMGPTVNGPPGAQAETLYMIYNDIPQGLVIQRSRITNRGLAWVMGNNRLPVSTNTGSRDHFAVDESDGTIYLPNKDGGGIAMYVSTDGANSFTRHQVLTTNDDIQNIFIAADVDNAGNVYISWSNQEHIFMGTSTDQGSTWSITRVTDTNGTRVLPWIVAGDPGRAALTWYDTPDTNGTSDEKIDANWSVQAAITTNGLSDNVTFLITPIMDYVHSGSISTGGTSGTADRDLGDFFTCDMDQFGRLIVTFGADGDDGVNSRQSVVMFAQQLEGPFLIENTGPRAIFTNRIDELTVHVDATRSFDRNGGGIKEYIWDWGDGSNSTGVVAKHTYNTSGIYNITLKVVNKINMRDTVSSLVKVKEPGEEPFDLCLIVVPIGLIVVGTAVVYYWYKKRRPKVVEVQAFSESSEESEEKLVEAPD
jgi:PKD repeat protein